MKDKEFRAAPPDHGLSGRICQDRARTSEMTQSELARLTRFCNPHLRYGNNSVNLGVEQAKVLAQALRCHPAVLVWDIHKPSAA